MQHLLTLNFSALVVIATCGHVVAAPTVFYGRDAGAGITSPRPNSSSAETSFLAAARLISPQIRTVDFEGLTPTLDPSFNIGQGASISSVQNVGGLRFDFQNGMPPNGGQDIGYNVTASGRWSYMLYPAGPHLSATISFDFPVSSWGSYFIGIGDAYGSIDVFLNGNAQPVVTLSGGRDGGAEFWGIADPAISVDSVTLRFVNGGPGDVFFSDISSIDNLSFTYVPEPSTGLIFVGLAALSCRRRMKGQPM